MRGAEKESRGSERGKRERERDRGLWAPRRDGTGGPDEPQTRTPGTRTKRRELTEGARQGNTQRPPGLSSDTCCHRPCRELGWNVEILCPHSHRPSLFLCPPPHWQDKGAAASGRKEMPEPSRMQGLAAGSWAPLGLLLVCLHLPGTKTVWALGRRTLGPPGTGNRERGEKSGGCTLGSQLREAKGMSEGNIRVHPLLCPPVLPSSRPPCPEHRGSGGESFPTLGAQPARTGTASLHRPLWFRTSSAQRGPGL